MGDRLNELWLRLDGPGWLERVWNWLRQPPGLYVALGLVAVLLLFAGWRRWRRSPEVRLATEVRRDARFTLRQAKELERQGDARAAGELYESLGKPRRALAVYRAGGCQRELALLLERLGKRRQARQEARAGDVWDVYARLSQEDGDLMEAAAAYERSSQDYAAARCFADAGENLAAARCYLRGGMGGAAVALLANSEGRECAELLETAVRTLEAGSGRQTPSAESQTALRRAVQLWQAEGEAERAFRLAADFRQWELAVPLARDHLPPSIATAEACVRAGAHFEAADLYRQLGDTRREALERAEYYLRREEPAAAAHWFEVAGELDQAAELRATAGDAAGSAALYERMGKLRAAAEMYHLAGEEDKARELLGRAAASQTELTTAGEALPPTGPAGVPPGGERYLLQDELARGGMGVVYRAFDQVLKRPVAYKVLSLPPGGDPEELLAEARATARLSHPNIVHVYDAGRRQDRVFQDGVFQESVFIVMELVEGESLAQLAGRRQLAVAGVVYIGRQICAALAHAHRRRILHRDLKPSNLLWTPEKQVKLTDFGIARAFDASGSVYTRPAGTPCYMAPEQIQGDAVDPRTDLYALGCVLYELLTQKTPFPGGEAMYHHLHSPPDDPVRLRPDVPAELSALVLRCLEKDPARRPPSAAEVGQVLAGVARR